MTRFISAILFFCLVFTGCSRVTHIRQETIPIGKWINSPDAKRGHIYLSGEITSARASNFIKKIDEINKNDDIERIRLFINVTGDAEKQLDVLIRGISLSKKDIDVINIGACYSTCVALYAAASGRRYAFPDTNFGLVTHKQESYRIQIKNIMDFKTEKYEPLIKEKANLPEEWFSSSEQPIFFTEKEAMQYNLIDEIITELP